MENLRNSFKKEKKLEIIKQPEFDIYYSCTHKWPLLVVESVDSNTGKTEDGIPFSRHDPDLKNPWKADKSIPIDCRLLVKNYRDYMEYGGSNGHNAPASWHKTTKKIYLSTFKLSNHCPQETVFNGTLWTILEIWCKDLQNDKNLTNIKVFTGSIPAKETTTFNTTVLNVPTHMFKIVTVMDKTEGNKPNNMYIACFLMPNVVPVEKYHKIYKNLVSLRDLTNIANIDFFNFFKEYSGFRDGMKIHSLKNKVRIDVHVSEKRGLVRQLKAAEYFGHLIYSNTLKELEANWNETKEKGFNDEYHEMYYKFCKKRINRDGEKVEYNKSTHKSSRKTKKNYVKPTVILQHKKTKNR